MLFLTNICFACSHYFTNTFLANFSQGDLSIWIISFVQYFFFFCVFILFWLIKSTHRHGIIQIREFILRVGYVIVDQRLWYLNFHSKKNVFRSILFVSVLSSLKIKTEATNKCISLFWVWKENEKNHLVSWFFQMMIISMVTFQ